MSPTTKNTKQTEADLASESNSRADTEARLRAVFETVVDAIITIDERGVIEAVNPAVTRMFGYAATELVGQSIGVLMPEPYRGEHGEYLDRYRRTGERKIIGVGREVTARCKDGTTVTVDLSVSEFHMGDKRMFTGVLRDITDRVRAEHALRVANEQLQEVDRRKTEFLAVLGHELRNPLAAISSATQLVRLTKPEDPRSRRPLEVIERQISIMARLLDGLFEVFHIAHDKIDLEVTTLDLREIVQRVLDDRRDEFTARGLELVQQLPSTPLWISGDSVRLTQVFGNLIGNALKYTEPPGIVTIRLEEDDGCAVGRVRDTGVGIRPDLLSAIFEPFRQESRPIDRVASGLGLGLAVAKGLVELHAGTIEAYSAGLGLGAEFCIRLPLVADPSTVDATPTLTPTTPRRILVVEDNEDVAGSLSDLLELLGHEAEVAKHGEAALDLLCSRPVDVVLCDLGLPGMSGYELAQVIRADESLRNLTVIALTGYGQVEDRSRTAEAGFDEHLVKPVTREALERTLERFAPPR